ncbi:MAG: ABC transporter ATP-binding protein [bacterium]|nr:ABC transporter ATP-binding protein [bacterium]
MSILSTNKLAKSYALGKASVPVLHDVTLSINAGEQVALVGPSGVGKSTLLHLLGALDRATSGEIICDGQEYSKLSSDDLAQLRSRKIGFVFQSHHLLPEFTALENVLMPAQLSRLADSNSETRARNLLERVGLGHRLSHRPGELSGGECQRVAVARALINSPAVVIADEPTGNLDGQAAKSVQELLLSLARENNTTLLIATHNLELARSMQRVLQVHLGNVSEDSSR